MWRQFQLLTQPSHIFNLLFDSRAMKLWNLRYMRKRIHKHLCKALARKVKYLLNHCRIVVCSFWGFFSILLVFYFGLSGKEKKILGEMDLFCKATEAIARRIYQNITNRPHQNIFQMLEKWNNRKNSNEVELRRIIESFFNTWLWRLCSQGIFYKFHRKSLKTFQQERVKRIVHKQWESWKFQLKILEMRERSENNWSLRCVRKCCQVWNLKVKKTQLGMKLHQSRSTFEILVARRKRILSFISLFPFSIPDMLEIFWAI
jgi:hypothetical protein